MRRRRLALGIALIAAVDVPAALAADEVAQLLASADLQAASGDTVAAAETLVRVADGWIDRGRLEDAERLLEAAVERFPDAARAWVQLGRLRLREKRYPSGREALERAVELGASDLRTLLYLGSARWEVGAAEEAEEAFRRAVTLSGEAPLPVHQLGRLLLWEGRAEEAAEVLRPLVDRGAPHDVVFDLAQAELGAGRAETALALFDAVLAQLPQHTDAHWGRGRSLAALGRREEAAAALETFRRLYEEDQESTRESGLLEAEIDRARYLVATGAYGEARAVLARLPPSVDVLVVVARAAGAAGDHQAAVDALSRAVAAEPRRGDLRVLLDEARLALQGGGG